MSNILKCVVLLMLTCSSLAVITSGGGGGAAGGITDNATTLQQADCPDVDLSQTLLSVNGSTSSYLVTLNNPCGCRLVTILLWCGDKSSFKPLQIIPRGIIARESRDPRTCTFKQDIPAFASASFAYEAVQRWPLEVKLVAC